MHAPRTFVLSLLLSAVLAAPGCAAERRGSAPMQVTQHRIDADRDGQPEDLRLDVTLTRVPVGRYRATATLGTPPLVGHASPHAEHRAIDAAVIAVAGADGACRLTRYFRASDVARLASAGRHVLRVELVPEPHSAAAPWVFESPLAIADLAAFTARTPRIRSVVGPSRDAPSVAVVEFELPSSDSLVVQASLVAPTFAVQTGSLERRFAAGRHTVRVRLADTPEAAGAHDRRGLRLVVEVIRVRDAQVVAMWDSGAP